MKKEELVSAYKRAKHFAPRFDGPFTSIDPCARNFAAAFEGAQYDAKPQLEELLLLDEWARVINRICDAEKIEENEKWRWMMGSFLSRCWLDPTKL